MNYQSCALSLALILLHSHANSSNVPSRRKILDDKEGSNPSHFQRLPEDEFLLPRYLRDQAVVYKGNQVRIRAAMEKLAKGNISIGYVGGSCTEGMGAVTPWPTNLNRMLQRMFPNSEIRAYNGARGGTTSTYAGLCIHEHVPPDVDLLMIEYAINDPAMTNVRMNNTNRAGFERLVRRALNMPNRPAVLITNWFRWSNPSNPRPNYFWETSEYDYFEFALYYSLPMISMKAAMFHIIRDGAHPNLTMENFNKLEMPTEDRFLYLTDGAHPGPNGSLMFAQLIAHYLQHVIMTLHHHQAEPAHTAWPHPDPHQPIPVPMLPNNYEPTAQSCFFLDQLRPKVKETKGFVYMDEAKEDRHRYGYVSTVPGSSIEFELNISMYNPKELAAMGKTPMPQLQIMHLKSYEGMATADVTCGGGCSCAPSVLDGWHEPKTSLVVPHYVVLTDLSDTLDTPQLCAVKVIQAEPLPGRGNKVKISGLVLTDEEKNKEHAYIFTTTAIDFMMGLTKEGRSFTP